MLISFLERFEKLGWMPPTNERHVHQLSMNEIKMHLIHESLYFYEYCSRGARGERDPWLTIFFHVDHFRRRIRICGVEFTVFFERARALTLERIANRVKLLEWHLKQNHGAK